MPGTRSAGLGLAGGTARDAEGQAPRRRAGRRARLRLAPWLLAVLTLACACLCSTASALPAGAGLGAVPAAVSPPKVTLQPTSVTVEEGQPASFTSAASNSPTVQWELSTDSGATWHPIEGATAGTYAIASTVTSESGHEFRAVFTNAGGTATSKAATLTVQEKPVVTVQPHDANAQEGHEASFESRASGSPAPTVQWQSSTDGGATWKNLTGATANVLKLNNVSKTLNGEKFRAVFKNAAGEAVSEAATLNIVDPPHVLRQPLSTTVIEGETATFTAEASGNPTPTVQWELSTDAGASWNLLTGATSDVLSIPATTPSQNGYEYRALFSNVAGTGTSTVAKLTVEGIPVVTQQPANVTVGVGGTATFEALGTGSPAPTQQWELSTNGGESWTPIAGATSTKLTVSGAQLSEGGRQYRAIFKNAAGSKASSAATLTVSATDYRAYGWGLNTRGQVGVGSVESSIPTPTPIGGIQFVTAVSAGMRHSLALLADGTVYVWGFNGHGQLGDEGFPSTRTPFEVENLAGVKAIAAGGNHSLALLGDGTVKAWGDDESGQLGDGKSTDSEVPVAVQGLSGVVAIAAGEEHSLALLSNGTVMAWGSNERGQLGTGNNKSSNTPVAVKGLSGVMAIAAGGQFSLALLENGTVMAWGDDTHDQLGNAGVLEAESEASEEEGPESRVPVEAEGLSGVRSIAAGRTHDLALLAGGTVMAWGNDSEGELGNGAIEPQLDKPTLVSGLEHVTAISAGDQDSVALLESGALMSWGMNNAGSLGIGVTGEAGDVPVQVHGLSQVKGVSAGGSHMLALGEALPSVTAISPQSGPTAGGGTVTITGLNLGAASAVRFGATAATTFTVESPTSITATAPAAGGTVDVTVTTPSGTSPTGPADRYTYRQPPTVTKLSAKGGPATGATSVTITGTELTGATEVSFGGVAATGLTVNSPTSITAVSPANVSGTANVTVRTVGGTSATSSKDRFKYAPVVESVTPNSGSVQGGASVTVTGAGFALGTNMTKFKFGKATSKSVQCASTTSCTVIVPVGKATGTVDVKATANKASSAPGPGDLFTYE